MNTRFSIGISALLVLLSTGLAAETLVYEREYTLIGEADNTLRIELSPDDRMIIHRPAFMTYPGNHRIDVTSGTYRKFRAAFEAARTDSVELQRAVQARAAGSMAVVTDPEFSRFALVDAQRGPLETVTVVSLEAWAQRIDDVRLQRLDRLERDWFSLMNSELQEAAR
ncbi:hypothetical protein [Halomonas denitrificans]|nr:hypothetical protein [Halomonas denitrificans]